MDAAERRRGAGPPDQFRAEHGAGRRQGLWRRRRHDDADRRRHRRHDLRRLAGARAAAFRARRETWLGQPFPQPHDGHAVGRRQEHRRGRRLDRLGRRRRACCMSARSSAGAVPGPVCLRPRRHPPDRDRRRGRARLSSTPTIFLGGRCGSTDAAARGRDPRATSPRRSARASRRRPRRSSSLRPSTWCRRSWTSPSTRASIRREAAFVAGGGAAGLNCVAIARRLGCRACWCRRPARRSRPPAR